MIEISKPVTVRLKPEDVESGFQCGKTSLDDYFAKYALKNDRKGIGVTYVLLRAEDDHDDLPSVLGFYTLSMAQVESALAAQVIKGQLPRYPLPVALIGRLASDERTRGRGLRVGETLLLDALARIVTAAHAIGCVGTILDALDGEAESFYRKYNFATVESESWPRRMFMPLATAAKLFEG